LINEQRLLIKALLRQCENPSTSLTSKTRVWRHVVRPLLKYHLVKRKASFEENQAQREQENHKRIAGESSSSSLSPSSSDEHKMQISANDRAIDATAVSATFSSWNPSTDIVDDDLIRYLLVIFAREQGVRATADVKPGVWNHEDVSSDSISLSLSFFLFFTFSAFTFWSHSEL